MVWVFVLVVTAGQQSRWQAASTMSDNNKTKKSTKTPAAKAAQKFRTAANKLKREKARARKLASKGHARRALQRIEKRLARQNTKGKKGPNIMNDTPANAVPVFTVLVKSTDAFVEGEKRKSKLVEGLSIESVSEHEKDKQTGEKPEASILFITKAGKKWKMCFSEFSFVFMPKAA